MSKAKNKPSKRSSSIPNKVLYSRVSYLYQAAVYLATIAPPPHHPKSEEDEPKNRNNNDFSELDTKVRNDKTNNLDIDNDVDVDLIKTAPPLSKNASKNAVAKVVIASKYVKQKDILNEVLQNDGIDEKEGNINSQDQHDTDRTHNLHSSLRPPTTTLTSSRKLVSELRAVSLKTQIRLSPQIKHSICKSCSTILIDGLTCSNLVENKSKGGKKPWADMLVKKCHVCDSVKRFPISTQRQGRETRERKKLFNGESPVGNRN